jgi:hypothetical protein
MNEWTNEELSRIADSTELQLVSRRPDGTLGSFTTMWVVRAGDDLYVRSAGGPDRPWYQHALARKRGHVRAGGVGAEVVFADGASAPNDEIDAAYHAKYDRYGPGPVSHVTGPESHLVTVKLVRSEP